MKISGMSLEELLQKSLKPLITIQILLAVIFIASYLLIPRTVQVDSVLYSIPGYNLAVHGQFTDAPLSFAESGKVYWQPPLWFFLEGITYKIIGYDFVKIHVLPLVITFAFVALMLFVVRKKYPRDNVKFLVALSILLCIVVVFRGTTNRPDILMGLFALILMISSNVFLLAIIAALSIETHVLGALFFL